MYKEMFKTDIQVRELQDLYTYRNAKFIDLIDRVICNHIHPTPEIQAVWKKHGKKTLFVKSRKRELVDGRVMACMLLREKKFKLTAIGSIMSRDHSTIIHNLQSGENLLDTSASFRRMYHNVKFEIDYENIIRPTSKEAIDSESVVSNAQL
jgi:hypothetical protein